MDKISVRQGETFQLPVEIDDTTAQTVQLLVWNDTATIIDETEPFNDGKATIDAGIIASDVGLYSYSVTITYSDGVVDILPDITDCTECDFPEFEVCEGNPVED